MYKPKSMKHKTTILFTLLTFVFVGICQAQSDMEKIRERIVTQLLIKEVGDSQIESLINTLKKDGSWPRINYVDVSRTTFEHAKHINNLVLFSQAFSNSSSKYFKRKELKVAFSLAVDFWIKHDFIADNWHSNEISNPQKWLDILLLMKDELTQEQSNALVDMAGRSNFNSWGARPGGDRIKIAGCVAELAIYNKDEQTLQEAIGEMANEINISSGRGLKPDLGFQHRGDRVTSILAYGTNYAASFAVWEELLAGTKYSFPERATKLLVDYYLDGICNSMVHAWYKDPGIINRGMARKGYLKPISAEIAENLMNASDYRKDELKNIVRIRKGEQKPNLVANRFFWHSEYQVHQRPEYHTSVRMHSERNHNMESAINMTSLKMHHYADGSNFISRTGKEYYDIFPVWDWQKIPGTTVVQKSELPSYKEIVKWGKTDFVGGVTDGTYGTAAFDFDSPHDDLRAYKSWFFFDKEYVCLGAGIQSDSENPVYTTINQCLLNGRVIANADKEKIELPEGAHELKKVDWIFHDSIAYLFPVPVDVSVRNKGYKGNWQDLTEQAWAKDEKEVQKDLFVVWINNGIRPNNASYEYIVKPAISENEINKYAESSPIRILANTNKIQAVQHLGLRITQIVFYGKGSIEIADGIKISTEHAGLVMLQSSGKKIESITVSDPTRKLISFQLELSTRFYGKTKLSIPLPTEGEAGKSVVIQSSSDLEEVLALHATDSENEAKFEEPRKDGKHYIGEKYGSGIIIWLDEKREHGLIAAQRDSHAEVPWKNGMAKDMEHFGDHGDRVTNAIGDGIGAGEMNTLLIVSQQTEDKFYGEFAAKVAVDCEFGGFGDWYLPSRKELDIMYELKDEIGGFVSNNYWSSTEYNVGFVWGLGFKHYKSEYTFNKGGQNAVRCVRKF
jgi:chondroitin AC lyase